MSSVDFSIYSIYLGVLKIYWPCRDRVVFMWSRIFGRPTIWHGRPTLSMKQEQYCSKAKMKAGLGHLWFWRRKNLDCFFGCFSSVLLLYCKFSVFSILLYVFCRMFVWFFVYFYDYVFCNLNFYHVFFNNNLLYLVSWYWWQPGIVKTSLLHWSQRWANTVFGTEYEYEYYSVSEMWPNTNTNTIRV